ncbi:unnamed protein product [Paramecium octaurelia]|uniref:Uncharacterized protein n=1 Tax=Paramecium octaurelia TaxID=43137 RepID=A0A8S1VZ06_PAROT|nr:unnamed protein product [Paramecium octaurelia]
MKNLFVLVLCVIVDSSNKCSEINTNGGFVTENDGYCIQTVIAINEAKTFCQNLSLALQHIIQNMRSVKMLINSAHLMVLQDVLLQQTALISSQRVMQGGQ